jgi:transposase
MRRWTPTEDDLARELVADGYTRVEIAEEMGRPVWGVKQRLRPKVLGIAAIEPRGHRDAELRARVLGYVGVGLGVSAVARRVGRKPQSVHALLRRLESDGLVRRTGCGSATRWKVTKVWTDDDNGDNRDEARAMARQGVGVEEIATRLGKHRDTICNWLKGGECG